MTEKLALGAGLRRGLRPDGDHARRRRCSTCRRSRGTTGTSSTRDDGDVIAKIVPNSRRAQHGLRPRRAEAVPGRAEVAAADGRRHDDAHGRRGPSARSRERSGPFTVNGRQTLCFVNVNDLLGFEVGDLTTGKKLHRVEVPGLQEGPGQAARLPEPRHRPDARREGALGRRRPQPARSTSSTPRRCRRSRSRAIELRDEPGWVTFSLDGRLRLPLDRRGDRRQDAEDRRRPEGRDRAATSRARRCSRSTSQGDQPVRTGDQFGVGRAP